MKRRRKMMIKEDMLKDDFVADNYGDKARNWVDPAFLDGVDWMEKKMIEKAVRWLGDNMFYSINNGIQVNGVCISHFIGRFRQAMEE